MKALTRLGLLAGLFAFAVYPHGVDAQTYPSKTVRVLVPNPPGAASDAAMRGIADVLTKSMGQSFVIENRPGADGTIAGQACATAAPDGHTLCLLDAFNVALNPSIYNNLPYDTINDMVPVMNIGFFAAGLWVNKDLPVNNYDELMAYAKVNPGKLNFATFGAASSSSIYVAWLKKVKGVEFTNVNYKSALDAYRSVLTGETQVASFALGAALANSKPGDIKLLAINNAVRMPEFPNTPTFKEAGLNGVLAWFGIFAPKNTPMAIVERLNAEVKKQVVDDAAVRKRVLETPGLQVVGPAGKSAQEFAAFVRDEFNVYAKLVADAGIEKTSR